MNINHQHRVSVTVSFPALEAWVASRDAKLDQAIGLLQQLQRDGAQEGTQLAMVTDQIKQLKELEASEHQAILDAAGRVDAKLNALAQDNPDLADAISGVQSDIAVLANVAAAAGTDASTDTSVDTSASATSG